jgi:GNAT superfamily N-acetyltransferase
MIRAATIDDIPVLLVLGELMHAESPRFSRLRFSPERLAGTLSHLIGNPDGFLWVACRDGRVVGGLAASAWQHWASTDLIASDLALFIEPASRGSLAPVRLVKRYREWAVERGAVIRQMGVTTGVHTETTALLLEQLGMKRCGMILED